MQTSGAPESPMAKILNQQIRITSHGKIKGWVTYALDFFEKNGDLPLVLHTIPPNKAEHISSDIEKPKFPPSLSVVPRLLSVVEIIKREYLKRLEATQSPRLSGLHQYNEIGCLEDLSPEEDTRMQIDAEGVSEQDRARVILRALEGKNHVRQQQTPYMKVSLSLVERPELKLAGVTYQPPSIRKISKSAKKRAKKRQQKALHVVNQETAAVASS